MARSTSQREPLHWIESTGGPFLVGCASVLAHWQGIGVGGGKRPTDYDRACSVDGYLGLIACKSGQVLVLGDAPMRSAFTRTADRGLAIARWHSSDLDVALSDAATTTFDLSSPEVAPRMTFRIASTVMLMLDASARIGVDNGETTGVQVVPGMYRVRTVWHTSPRKGAAFKFLIHQISKIGF